MKTGIYIRAQIDRHWENIDISDSRVPDERIFEWLRSRGGCNPWAERVVMMLLGRDPATVRGEIVKKLMVKEETCNS